MTQEELKAKWGDQEHIFLVPAENFDTLRKKITKINAKADKLGCEPVRFERLATEILDYSKFNRMLGEYEPKQREVDILRIEGAAPKFEGWTFAATIEATEAGNLFHKAPSFDPQIPESFRKAEGNYCDHCKAARRRKRTFIIHNEETGEFRQVGSTCIADFLGGANPEDVAKYAEYLFEGLQLPGLGDDLGGWGWSDPDLYSVKFILRVTMAQIRNEGFMSSSRARELGEKAGDGWYPTTTANRIAFALEENGGDRETKREREALWEALYANIKPGDKDEATEIIFHFATQADPKSDYLWNLKVLAENQWITRKQFGYVCSMVPTFRKMMDRIEERKRNEADKVNEWLGEIKQRAVFSSLTVVRISGYESDFGSGDIIKLEDAQGRRLTWFTTSYHQMVEGGVYDLRATVKAHQEWKGRKDTLISRAKVEKVISEPKPEPVAEEPSFQN